MGRTPIDVIVISFLVATAANVHGDVLWQTNSGGNDIHLLDARTLEPLDRIVVGPNPHGIATDHANRTVYVTLEHNSSASGELLWIDPKTRTIEHRMKVGPEPHQLAVTPDGVWAYVPCRDGHYWVINTHEPKLVKRIETGGRPHNTTISPDGRFAYLSPMGPKSRVTVVAIGQGHEVVGQIQFSNSVRPPAISGDGVLLFQHVDGLNGFEVARTEDLKIAYRIEHSSSLGWFLARPKKVGWVSLSGAKRCHGLAMRPDNREVWSVCGNYLAIHDAQPPHGELSLIELPAKAYWLTFDQDSTRAFIALPNRDQVAVIDTKSRSLESLIDVGKAPKRKWIP